MPATVRKISPELGIKLEREQPAYTLPDTVVGHVFRRTPLVASKAVLTIALVGRSKSRMVVRHGSWGRIYRGRFPLLNEEDHKQTLLEAPIHIPVDAEEKMWPFAITLPTQYDAVRTASGTSPSESFLSLGSGERAMYRLPPSFLAQKWGFGEGMGCFVEYFLRAELTTTSRNSTQTVEAIQPLVITTLHRNSRSFSQQRSAVRHEHVLQDAGILPEPQIDSSSTTDQTPAAADPSSLGFDIVIQTPKYLELDQSDPISVFLRAEPKPPGTSMVDLLTSHEIVVEQMLLDLVASTSIKCHGRPSAREASIDTKFVLSAKDTCQDATPLLVPWISNDQSAETASAGNHAARAGDGQNAGVNAGRHLRVQLPDEGVYESFRTHNICEAHRLEWTVTVNIAGQRFISSGAEGVEIVAPSRDNEPVDYATLETESLERRQSTVSQVMSPVYGRRESEHALPPRPRKHDKKGGSFGLARLWEGL